MRGHSRNTFLYTTQFSDSIFCKCKKVKTSRLVYKLKIIISLFDTGVYVCLLSRLSFSSCALIGH